MKNTGLPIEVTENLSMDCLQSLEMPRGWLVSRQEEKKGMVGFDLGQIWAGNPNC